MHIIPNDLQYFQLDSLDHRAKITINLPNETMVTYVTKSSTSTSLYLHAPAFEIFPILSLDKSAFVKEIVGYTVTGAFPEVKTKEDLLKVIIALDKECIKKFGDKTKTMEQKLKVGDTVEILPREGDEIDYEPSYVDQMVKYAGKTARITNRGLNGYLLDIDEDYWDWPAKALKKVEDKKFKDGDYVCVPSKRYIAIFKEYEEGTLYRYAYCFTDQNHNNIDYISEGCLLFCNYSDIRLATQDEVDILNSKLNKAGLVWNPCEKKVINCSAKAVEISTESKTNLLETEASNAHPVNYFPTKKHYQFKFNL